MGCAYGLVFRCLIHLINMTTKTWVATGCLFVLKRPFTYSVISLFSPILFEVSHPSLHKLLQNLDFELIVLLFQKSPSLCPLVFGQGHCLCCIFFGICNYNQSYEGSPSKIQHLLFSFPLWHQYHLSQCQSAFRHMLLSNKFWSPFHSPVMDSCNVGFMSVPSRLIHHQSFGLLSLSFSKLQCKHEHKKHKYSK